MPEYAKMKNADLEALLKGRGLPTGGKKADMVERLTKDDEQKPAPSATKAAVNTEDEIDWDDEGDEAAVATTSANNTSTPKEEKEKAAGEGQASNPSDVTSHDANVGPAQTENLNAEPSAEGDEAAKTEQKNEPAPDYSKGLAATNLDEEIERRKKRAAKFGLKIEDDEGLKKLERAKKFGDSGPPKGLDEALPERSRKRGREGGDDASDSKRRGGGRAGGRGGRDRRDNRDNRNRGDREPRKEYGGANGGASWMSDKDKAAAEARKAKWSKAAAS